MKKLTAIILLALISRLVLAQDTAYVSREKVTALFFPSAVKILYSPGSFFNVSDKGYGVITLKATTAKLKNEVVRIKVINSRKIVRIPVSYSYGRAGRRISYATLPASPRLVKKPAHLEELIARQLAAGKRTNIATHVKSGGIKAWIDKITLAGNRVFIRLDVRNRSNLPYDIDFVRFYVRDRKTVDRMATHEQEVEPLYSTLRKTTVVMNGYDVAKIFVFKRFSLSHDEVLFVEVYERAGNRHLYLQVRQRDLEDVKIIPLPHAAALTLVANK